MKDMRSPWERGCDRRAAGLEKANPFRAGTDEHNEYEIGYDCANSILSGY